ncbi:MAG: mono/diheme cytochrome c family protein [Porticoccaceae bacterium]|jgi:mono/diheme cytochrome c family protein
MIESTAHPRLSDGFLPERFLLGLQLAVAFCLLVPADTSADNVSFNHQIRPIFAEHCLQCHGPDAGKREADLRLDLEHSAKENAIVAGHPEKSELLRRLTTADPDERMPPPDTGKTLSAAQIQLVRQWIQDGAKFEGHWSFEPISKPTIPVTRELAKSDIDRFVVARLEEAGLRMTSAISRQQLIRRASFDLIGLPPTWEEVTAFVGDDSPQAFEKVIDRLLESPRYGERWGRHWLDIARYADTLGGSAIGFTKFPFSYTYRDYVIRSLNADVPYDQFVTEQLAADQLGLAEGDPALAGLGFLTVGMQYRNPHDTIDDQIDVVTRGLLGLTVACARCHDHKYDAVPTTDYYSLYATFASSSTPNLLPEIRALEASNSRQPKAYQDYQVELARRQRLHIDMAREQSVVMRGRLRMQVGLYLKELAKGTPEQDLSAAFLSYRTDDLRPLVLNAWRDYLKVMSGDDPVFGPWVRLSTVQPEQFREDCEKLVETLTKENGDASKFPKKQSLAGNAPRWNPRMLTKLAESKPASMIELAEAYGSLFGEVQAEWLRAVLATTLEAQPGATVVPDEDARHGDVNSAVNRQLRHHLYADGTPTAMPDDVAVTLLNRPVRDNLSGRKGAIHNLHLSSPGSPPRAMTLREKQDAGDFHVFRRGSAINRGELVQARFLTALTGTDAKSFADGKRRLGLAQAIVDPVNPLTRRIAVNWVWQHHFGQALVRTPDDFGIRGQPPTHPKLLDYLASKLLDDGWSLKKLHRRIMLSAVYRQGAIENSAARIADPDNKLLWRMPRRRLELEAMRDSMLLVSGELDTKLGGRPFDFLSKPVVPRRSIYAFINRDIVSSLASTFDAANPNSCTAIRPETNVPQQTLFALNSDFIQDRAVALAAVKQVATADTDEDRIRTLYQRTYSRLPDPDELELALRFVQSQTETSEDRKPATNPWHRLAHVLLASNEFIFVD